MVKILITVLVSWNRSRKKNYRLISYRIFRNLLNHLKRILLLLYKESLNAEKDHWTSNCERQKFSNHRTVSVSSTFHTIPKEHLTAPPSSTNWERLFSYGGLVATDHCASLAADKLDHIRFLRENALIADFDLCWLTGSTRPTQINEAVQCKSDFNRYLWN